jgi:hypothetical protein
MVVYRDAAKAISVFENGTRGKGIEINVAVVRVEPSP